MAWGVGQAGVCPLAQWSAEAVDEREYSRRWWGGVAAGTAVSVGTAETAGVAGVAGAEAAGESGGAGSVFAPPGTACAVAGGATEVAGAALVGTPGPGAGLEAAEAAGAVGGEEVLAPSTCAPAVGTAVETTTVGRGTGVPPFAGGVRKGTVCAVVEIDAACSNQHARAGATRAPRELGNQRDIPDEEIVAQPVGFSGLRRDPPVGETGEKEADKAGEEPESLGPGPQVDEGGDEGRERRVGAARAADEG